MSRDLLKLQKIARQARSYRTFEHEGFFMFMVDASGDQWSDARLFQVSLAIAPRVKREAGTPFQVNPALPPQRYASEIFK